MERHRRPEMFSGYKGEAPSRRSSRTLGCSACGNSDTSSYALLLAPRPRSSRGRSSRGRGARGVSLEGYGTETGVKGSIQMAHACGQSTLSTSSDNVPVSK